MNIADDLIDALFDRTSKPPPILYKYLSDERVEDVLGNSNVRFTPLSNTNDTFEIRTTFKNFAGPKLIKMFEDADQIVLSDEVLNKLLEISFDDLIKEQGIPLQNRDQLFEYFKNTRGENVKENAKNDFIKNTNSELFSSLNSEEQIDKFLEAMGKKLCFSLSEQADIPPMWAHYANSHKGFVIAFDTKHIWFKEWQNGKSKSMLKVHYFDDTMEEPLDNPIKAIASKKTDWKYEREWRTYATEDQVDRIEGTTEEPIHLMNFPPDAIQRIILGAKINPEVESRIKEIACAKYPHAKLHRMDSNLLKSRMEEVKV